jgi:hypothetical protein
MELCQFNDPLVAVVKEGRGIDQQGIGSRPCTGIIQFRIRAGSPEINFYI